MSGADNNSTKTTPSKSEDSEFDFPVESVPCTTNTPPQSSTDISNDTPSLSEDNPSNVKASRRSNRMCSDCKIVIFVH